MAELINAWSNYVIREVESNFFMGKSHPTNIISGGVNNI